MSTPVTLSVGDTVVDLEFTYSQSAPRPEVIQTLPGTPWTPMPRSGLHHLGRWSEAVAADSERLVDHGSPSRRPGQPRPVLEQCWSSGRM